MDVELLEEISALINLPPVRPKGFGITVSEFVRRNRVLRERAIYQLEDMIENGVLEKMEMRYSTGRGGTVYYRKGAWPPKDKNNHPPL